MDLEEAFLEDVFRRRAVPEEADEEVEQLALVALDELRKSGLVPVAVTREELLIRRLPRRHARRALAPDGLFAAGTSVVAVMGSRVRRHAFVLHGVGVSS